MSIPFGVRARDIVTKFEGTITGRTEWMTSCTSYCLMPEMDKDGKVQDGKWFDEARVEILGGNPIQLMDHSEYNASTPRAASKKSFMDKIRSSGGDTPPAAR